jgi:hypothetical protein
MCRLPSVDGALKKPVPLEVVKQLILKFGLLSGNKPRHKQKQCD